MEAPRPHVTNRWKFNSGTYYVEAPEEKRLPGWVFYVCIFLLLSLIFAAILIAVICADSAKKQEKKNSLFLNEFHTRCDTKGNWTEDKIIAYQTYFFSYKGKNISEVCNSLECYLENQQTIEKYNNQTEKGVHLFGNTVFSDWCGIERQSYVRTIRSASRVKARISTNKTTHFSLSSAVAPKIIFNDTLPIDENVRSALLQWAFYTSNTSSTYPTFDNFSKKFSDEYILYDFEKPTDIPEQDDFHKRYLIQEGVFATEVYLNDLVFFYQDGVLPRKVCDATYYHVVKFPVIVIGYGMDENTTQYWEVQPIGEHFKSWGRNSTMRIHDTCYKKMHNPRIVDVDVRSRQNNLSENGLAIGKLNSLPWL